MGVDGEEKGRSCYQNQIGLQTIQSKEQEEKEKKEMIVVLGYLAIN